MTPLRSPLRKPATVGGLSAESEGALTGRGGISLSGTSPVMRPESPAERPADVAENFPKSEPEPGSAAPSGIETGTDVRTGSTAAQERIGPLAPFASSTYRMFWAASLLSNTGTWIHEIGAGWLMSTLDGSPQMVSAVRTAMALPMILLALPAGALSDRVDRRRLMLVVQCWLMAVATSLAVLSWLDRISPFGLLALTFAMGIGTVLHVPTWQASIPEIVERKQLPQAIALGSLSFNLARSVGPAVGGLLIAGIGIWAAFGVNALSFGFVLLAVVCWRRTRQTTVPADTFIASMRDGLTLAFAPGELRWTLIRVGLFVVPASSLWALLPLVARQQLAWDASGYGYLVGAIGLGAVLGAAWLPRLRSRFGPDTTMLAAMLLYAVGLAIISASSWRPLSLSAAMMIGAAWMTVLTTLNSSAQFALADEVRARGMACYLSSMAVAMALGGILWGWVAAAHSPGFALAGAACVLVLAAPVAAGRVGK
ncbi:MAG: MFS transporter [Planctomycetaceae bacterium]|nr:MAG: MFS transporter [Planctomycetaceae bacterium]